MKYEYELYVQFSRDVWKSTTWEKGSIGNEYQVPLAAPISGQR